VEEPEDTGEQQREILEKQGKKLPDKLTIEQVKEGFAKVEAQARACGKQHDAAPGTKVKIKVTIVGASGKVSSAKALGPHANTQLGWCVEDAAREARFPRFAKTQIGLIYPFVVSGKEPETEESGKLPDKLTIEQVKEGFSKVEAEARACGKQHDAAPGTKVKIKVTIGGATGEVRSAVAVGPHADTRLGRCVADAAREARFPRFAKSVMGVVYPFTM
jgi:hypothetical protein